MVSDGILNLSFLAVKDQAKISGIQLSVYSEGDAVNRSPVVVNPGKIYYFEGADVKLSVSASDLDQDKLSFSSIGLPASLNLDPVTGLVSGTVEADAGIYPVSINVEDGRGGTGTATFDMEIIDPAVYSLRINSGGVTSTFSDQTWRADQFYIGGSTYKKTVDIAGTTLDPVFQTERYGKFAYQIPVPGNGRFKVNLMFAEKYFSGPNMRLFNILFEAGSIKRSSLDVFTAAGGALKAYQEQFFVDVNDGVLDIQFESLINNAMIGGIELTACVQPVIYSVSVSSAEITTGQPVTIKVNGVLNSAEKWALYSGSCGQSLLATSVTGIFELIPSGSTTYFIRPEGSCVKAVTCVTTEVKVLSSTQPSTSGRISESEEQPLIFPNPVNRTFQIRLPETWGNVQVLILDQSGSEVALEDWMPGSGLLEFNLSNFPPGMYLVRFTSDNKVLTRRIFRK